MRIIIINYDYPGFLTWFYGKQPGLAGASYQEQMRARNDSMFGVADYYSLALASLGHEGMEIHFNNEHLQMAWARENMAVPPRSKRLKVFLRGGFVPWAMRIPDAAWVLAVLREQIRQFKPDALFIQAPYVLTPEFLSEMKSQGILIVGEHAATPLPEDRDWKLYDLFVSSFPPTLDWLRARGVRAELMRLGAGQPILDRFKAPLEKTIELSFVGSLMAIHSSRTALLELIRKELPLKLWGPAPGESLKGSNLMEAYQGEAWGLDMLNVMARSKITINHHGDIAPFANNLRLYEATAVHALLVTDWKANLHEMYEPEAEVVTYRDPAECLEKIKAYLADDAARAAIANAGHERTRRDHMYKQRMSQLVEMIGSIR